jgi:dihydrolipoamide dehydrogenase
MFDLTVIGAGPAGYVAALYAARKGLQVALVEKNRVGGVCMNVGCIPSKALIASAETLDRIQRAAEFGIEVGGTIHPNLPAMMSRKEKIVDGVRRGVETLIHASKIALIAGEARLAAANKVAVGDRVLECRHILLAMGSVPAILSGFPFSGKRVLSTDHILALQEIPRHLLVLGSGPAGLEMAFFYAQLGSQVTVVELLPRALPMEDESISRLIEREMKKRKIAFLPNVQADGVEEEADKVILHLPEGKTLEGDYIFVSVGRAICSRGIGLEEQGVKVSSKGEILVDKFMRTSASAIYGAGDVIGGLMLAHVASAEGRAAVDSMLGNPLQIRYESIPWGIFTVPEIGRVGLTEKEARERYHDIRVGRFPYRALGKAMAIGETSGEAKIVALSSGEILGAHIIGFSASDLVQEISVLMQSGAKLEDLGHTVFAHPTLSEVLMEALEDLEGLSLHQLPKF